MTSETLTEKCPKEHAEEPGRHPDTSPPLESYGRLLNPIRERSAKTAETFACIVCDATFERKGRRKAAKYCGPECRAEANRQRALEWQRLRIEAIGVRGSKCAHCGAIDSRESWGLDYIEQYHKEDRGLEFHHVNGDGEEDRSRGTGGRGYRQMYLDIIAGKDEKTELVCRACHNKRERETKETKRAGPAALVAETGSPPEMPQTVSAGHGNGTGTNEAAAAAVRQALQRRLRAGAEDAILRRVRSLLTRRPR